jgi:hypothetical protein
LKLHALVSPALLGDAASRFEYCGPSGDVEKSREAAGRRQLSGHCKKALPANEPILALYLLQIAGSAFARYLPSRGNLGSCASSIFAPAQDKAGGAHCFLVESRRHE